MKRNILFLLTITAILASCQQHEFNDKYTGTLVWPVGAGMPNDITCEPNGNNCYRGLITDDLAPNIEQYYIYLDQLPPSNKDLAEGTLNKNDPAFQMALFIYYKNKLNVKDYFKKENWAALFIKAAEDQYLKNIITNGTFDLLFVKDNDSILFVKDARAGYSSENVLYAFKASSTLFNKLK